MHDLEDKAAAGSVDGVQHFLLAGPLLFGGEAHLDAGGPGLRGNVAVSGDDGAHAAGGDLAVEVYLLGGAGAVPAAEGVLGGGAQEPVGQLQGADLAGGKEFGSHGDRSPFSMDWEAFAQILLSLHYSKNGEGWQQFFLGPALRPLPLTHFPETR